MQALTSLLVIPLSPLYSANHVPQINNQQVGEELTGDWLEWCRLAVNSSNSGG